MIPLSAKRRSELRAEAHKLSPVVLIGDKGLTDQVMAEIERALKAHELIKVRAATAERDARGAWLATICAQLAAQPVQQIGKVFVIYRENPREDPPRRVLAPRAARKAPPPASTRRAASVAAPRGRTRPRGAPKPPAAGAARRRRPRAG